MSIRNGAVWKAVALHACVVGLLVPAIYYGSMHWRAFRIGRVRNQKGPVNVGARLVDEGPGFNPCNLYWVVEYDCHDGDLEIKGVVPKARYWSLVAYDYYTMPLASCLSDTSIQKNKEGAFTAYLSTRPKGRSNEIDVSASPRGMVLIRLSFPEDHQKAADMTPQVRVLPKD